MAQKIIIKKSTVAGKVPTPQQLDIGELAVNTADAQLYTKHSDGSVIQIGWSLIRTPRPIAPLTGEVQVIQRPFLVASPFATLYSSDIRDYRHFELTLATDPDFTTPILSIQEDANEVLLPEDLILGTEYLWRCRDVCTGGVPSAWSEVQAFVSAHAVDPYIPTPAATPAIGDPFEGGYYTGMIWNEIAQSADHRVLVVGTHTFTIPAMLVAPIAYVGQLLEVRSRSNPTNHFSGTVVSVVDDILTLDATTVSGGGGVSDWSIMARFRVIVAPKALGESPRLPIKSTDTILPPECQTLSEGWLSTNAMTEAGGGLVYPAAHWARDLVIDGYDDWYIPSRDELELIWRYLKPTTLDNYIPGWDRPASTLDYMNRGAYADGQAVERGHNLNSFPQTGGYTLTDPAMTPVTIFQNGGSEEVWWDNLFWTSSAYSDTRTWRQHWSASSPGNQYHAVNSYQGRVRAVRRSII